MTRVELPWPHRWLHPNARTHWAQKATAAKNARRTACYTALEAGARGMAADALDIAITFYPPDKRRRDVDGMLSSVKSYLDGIADVVGVDDSNWRISMQKAEPRKGGVVVVEIQPA